MNKGLQKVTPAETSIQNDIWVNDQLERKPIADLLTRLLENNGSESGFVLNIDAAWGTGKTFFLKHWHEQLKENHPAVYFSAWEVDDSEDPFVPFIAEILEQIQIYKSGKQNNESEQVKTYKEKGISVAKALGKGIVKQAVKKYAGDEVAEMLGDATDASLDAGLDIYQNYAARKKSIEEFKKALTELLDTTGIKPLYILIDELDRCRPTFTIELLERIKHIFNLPNIVFIVATDTKQLCASIKAVYGNEFDAQIYLERFFDLKYTLPLPSLKNFIKYLNEKYPLNPEYNYLAFNPENVNEFNQEQHLLSFSIFCNSLNLSLRQVEQLWIKIKAITYLYKAQDVKPVKNMYGHTHTTRQTFEGRRDPSADNWMKNCLNKDVFLWDIFISIVLTDYFKSITQSSIYNEYYKKTPALKYIIQAGDRGKFLAKNVNREHNNEIQELIHTPFEDKNLIKFFHMERPEFIPTISKLVKFSSQIKQNFSEEDINQ